MPLNLKETTADWLVCKCGNEPHKDGFYTCLVNGEIVEPVLDGPWDGTLYLCAKCDAIYNIDTFDQVGVATGAAKEKNILSEL